MFDPYYTWLGIPPDEQPADYYRLLGLRRFEPNPAVISNASDRQLAHVRTFQSGPHSLESQRLLNEIAAATNTLLNPSYKAAYDQQLAAAWNYSRQPVEPPRAYSYQPVLPVAAPYVPAPPRAMDTPAYVDSFSYGASSGAEAATDFQAAPEAFFAPSESSYVRRKRPAESSFATLAKIIVGGAVGLAIGWVIINRLILPLQAQRDRDQALNPERKKHSPKRPLPAPKEPDAPRNNDPPPLPVPPVPPPGDNSPRPEDNDNSVPKPPKKDPAPPESNSEPKSAPTPPPVTETNPFAQLPGMIALPDFKAETTFPLLALACPPSGAVTITLDSGHVDLNGARLNVTPQGESETEWTVSHVTGEGELSVESIVSSLALRGTTLELKWTDTESDATKQLANCFLHLASGPHRHDIQLRVSDKQTSVTMDLDAARQAFKIDLSPQPIQSSLALLVEEMVNFPPDAKLRGNKARIELGQEATIEFEETLGAAVEIKFGRQTDGSVAVIVSTVFREKKGGQYELTRQRLEGTTEAAEQWLDDASGLINQLESQLSSLESDYNALLSSGTSGGAPQADRNIRLSRLKAQIQATRSRLRNMQRQVPEMRARVDAAPAMKEFLAALHMVAQLRLRIVSASPTRELGLVEFTK